MSGIHFVMGSFFVLAAVVAYLSARGVAQRFAKLIFSLTLGVIILALESALLEGAYRVIGWLPGWLFWVIIPTFYICLLIILFSKPTEVDDEEEEEDRGFLFNKL